MIEVLTIPGAWVDHALCAEADPDAWFPDKGESPRLAKRVCAGCPVRAECLENALERAEPWGVWGGTTPRQRRALLRAREAVAA